jgi:alpha-tubulin suppressor-like RCC1 family protein
VRAFHTTLGASAITTADYWIVGAVVAGGHHTVAVKSDATVWAWGNNASGQLGDGTQWDRTTPVQVTGLTNVVAVAAGRDHTLAVKRDGTAWSWGYNGSGQLGDNSTTPRLAPVQVSGLTDVIAVAAGQTHSLALKKDGTVWRWGDNQLVPVQVAGLSGVSRIAASNAASIALRTDGALSGSAWTWGSNLWGQLGDGTTMPRSTPQPIIADIIAIGTGEDHLFAIQADGTPWAWGVNGSGRLGDGTTTSPRYTPVKTLDLAAVTIVGGSNHSIARGTDGSAWSWGDGSNVGLTALTGSNILELPQRTPGAGHDVANVAAGLEHSIASRRDGSLWSWGVNADGQLGVGDTAPRDLPTPIPSFSLTDPTWLLGDQDGDGLLTWQEFQYGSDPVTPDTNGDGLLDGAAAASGKSLLNVDMDADGVTNLIERSRGTDPFRVDSDGDTYSDGVDAFPLDPSRWNPPAPIPGDTTPPVITLTYPTTAVPVPPI